MFDFNIKIVFAALAVIFELGAYVPYLKDIFAGKTKPHVYTWLIWALTTGTAAAGLWYGGGGYGAVSQTILAVLTFLLFVLSLKYGTKNITVSDTSVLFLALCAIAVWRFLNNPLLAVLMVTAIDAFGYLPSFRKCFAEPWSESLNTWVMFTAGALLSLLAVSQYNMLTTVYLAVTVLSNIVLISICLFRRPLIPKPSYNSPDEV